MRSHSSGTRLPGAVYGLAGLAFVLRLAWRIRSGSEGFFQNGYSFLFLMARNIATGHGIMDSWRKTFRVPVYPIFLAVLTRGHQVFWPVVLAQSLIGAGTALGAAVLARQMFGGRVGSWAAVIAAGYVAVYPYYVVHDTALQETSLFTFLTLSAVISLQRAAGTGGGLRGALSGLLLGVDVLTRATIAPFALFASLWLMWRKRWAAGGWCLLLLAMTISPWIWRSYRLTGYPVLSTETGQQVWRGNNGYLFRYYPQQSSDLSMTEANNDLSPEDRRELASLANDEALMDGWYMKKALLYMRAHPWITVRDDVRKVVAVFGWLPVPRHGRLADLMHVVSYGPAMVLGLWGMWRRRSCWRDDSLIYLLFLTFIPVVAIIWGDTSHRSYLDVYWIVFGASAVASATLGAPGPSTACGE